MDLGSTEWIMQEYGLNELKTGIQELFPKWQLSLEDILSALMQGRIQDCFLMLKKGLYDQLILQFEGFKGIFISLLLIGILSAVLVNISDIFQNRQIADVSYYFVYLLMVLLLLGCFEQAAGTMSSLTGQVTLFMKLFLPTYFMVVGMASGSVTAGTMYQVLLFLIYLIQIGISTFLLPAVYAYVFLNMVNGLWMEERLSLLMELLKKGICFALKTIITAVMGISVIQSMITPVIDSLKGAAMQKAVSSIPGLGNLAGGVTEMMIGSAVLVKNSIGTCMLLLLLVLCLLPLMKLLGIAVLLKGAAAVMGMIADKRMTACADRVGEGCLLLFRAAVTILTLFMITIAIISYTTNRGF